MDIEVSVIVPIRNEEKYIAACLKSLSCQNYSSDEYEIIVVDGRSSDRSLDIVRKLQCSYRNIRCLDNPVGIVPAGMNTGIYNSRGRIIIRADGHNYYPPDYIKNCVKYLKETGADNVGGPWLTVPAKNTFGAKLVAAVLSNPFGVGNSSFRTSFAEGFVETVPFGAFRRELFERIGMYNEKLVRNQDNELNARIRRAGGKVYQTPALTTEYHPVAEFSQLLKQTLRTSQWHLFSIGENRRSMSVRHLAPAAFLAAIVGFACLSLFNHLAVDVLSFGLLLYLCVGLYFGVRNSRSYGLPIVCCFPFACLMYHATYGVGTLMGLPYVVVDPSASPIRDGQPIISADRQ